MTDQNQKLDKKFIISQNSTFFKNEDFEEWFTIQTGPGPTMVINLKPENPPAFPLAIPESEYCQKGMTLWDYYAAHPPFQFHPGSSGELMAKTVADYATAMLAERAKRGIR